MLSINKEALEDKMHTFLDVLNTNGEVNIEWIKTKKAKFDLTYNETIELLDKYKRNKGKLLKQINSNNILTPQYIDEYELDDIKDLINNTIKDESERYRLDKEVNRLKEIEDRITSNIDELDKVFADVSNRKGINNIDKLEFNTFDEHYYDIDRMREERGITFGENVVAKEIVYKEDNREELDDEMEYTFDGSKSLKDIAEEVYDNPSYWTHIFNYEDNYETIKKELDIKTIDYDKVSKDPNYLKGITLKIPKEIVFYTDEFNTQVLKQIKL